MGNKIRRLAAERRGEGGNESEVEDVRAKVDRETSQLQRASTCQLTRGEGTSQNQDQRPFKTLELAEDVDMSRSNAGVLPTCTPDRSKDQAAAKSLHILEGDRRPFKTLELAEDVDMPRSNAGVLPTCTPDRSKDQAAAKSLHILEGD